MHCPKCGLQQITGEVKYCSRCGFYLGVVSDLLNGNGVLGGQSLAAAPPLVTAPPGPSLRKKQIRRGAKIMFLSVVVLPIFIGISIMADGGEPLFIPFTIFLAGLFYLIYHSLFTDDSEVVAQYQGPLQAPPPRQMLRAEENRVSGQDSRRVNTADMANPPSVTDHTTRLFDNE